MKAVIYGRVSTRGQEDNYSFDTQETDCLRYAARHSFNVIETFADVKSGATLDRDALTQLREMVRNKQTAVVIVGKLDRLSRSVGDLHKIVNECNSADVELHFADIGKAESTPMGKMFLTMCAAFAEFERDTTQMRFSDGKRTKAKQGKVVGDRAIANYGYCFAGVGKDKTFEIDLNEAPIVKLIYQWYLECTSVYAVTIRLTDARIPTPRDNGRKVNIKKTGLDGKPYQQREAGCWNVSTVTRILRETAYVGTLHQFKSIWKNHRKVKDLPIEEMIATAIPAIIDQATFDAVQTKLDLSRTMSTRNSKQLYLLGQRLKCECSHSMCGEATKGQYRYYRCAAKGINTPHKCTTKAINANTIETIVWRWLFEQLQPETLLHGLQREQETTADRRTEITAELDTLQRQRADLTNQARRLQDAYAAGVLELADLAAGKKMRDVAIKSLDTDIAKLIKQLASAGLSDADRQSLLAVAAELSDEAQHVTSNEERRWLVDRLDVRVAIVYNATGQRCAKVVGRLSIAPDVLPLDNSSAAA